MGMTRTLGLVALGGLAGYWYANTQRRGPVGLLPAPDTDSAPTGGNAVPPVSSDTGTGTGTGGGGSSGGGGDASGLGTISAGGMSGSGGTGGGATSRVFESPNEGERLDASLRPDLRPPAAPAAPGEAPVTPGLPDYARGA